MRVERLLDPLDADAQIANLAAQGVNLAIEPLDANENLPDVLLDLIETRWPCSISISRSSSHIRVAAQLGSALIRGLPRAGQPRG